MIDRDILLRALAAKAARHAEVARLLESPEVVVDHNKVRVLAREMGQLREFARIHRELVAARKQLDDARALAASETGELKEMAEAEAKEAEERLPALWEQAETAHAEADALADRDVILEIRAGVGGDEAAIFAGDLFDMYGRFCARHELSVEVLDQSPGEHGGFKEIVAQVSGEGAYHQLRLEGGVHRVQRVPKTETQGRIHTSTATVAVLPEAEEVEIDIDWAKDVREDTMRAGGPGGQKVNKTESAIRLTHEATGIMVHMQDEKSQHKNRARARQILAARLFDHFQSKIDAERAASRKSMVGKADRSTKIRTYNFPQDRATDHRIEFSVFNLAAVMAGKIEPFHEKLRLAEREEKLKALIASMQTTEGE